jgi:hypothetical protein
MSRATTLVLTLISVVSFAASSHSAGRMLGLTQNDAPHQGPITLRGCLQAEPRGQGFVLMDARPSQAGSATSPLTSAGAGTSATGEAPSGTVSGKTPTGGTATTTSAPMPEAGTAGTTANPASPTFNQGDATAGTTGTDTRSETAGATPVRKYQLSAGPGVNLSAYAGHMVEVRGTMKPSAGTPAAEPAPREGRGSATAEPTSEMRAHVLEVTSLAHVGAGCRQ